VLTAPLPAGIAGGITLAIAGFVVVVIEAVRDPVAPPDDGRAPEDHGPASSPR
jgi:hypothetical protein